MINNHGDVLLHLKMTGLFRSLGVVLSKRDLLLWKRTCSPIKEFALRNGIFFPLRVDPIKNESKSFSFQWGELYKASLFSGVNF